MAENNDTERERARFQQALDGQEADEFRLHPGYQSHEHLLQIVQKLPTD